MNYKVKNIKLARQGQLKIAWAEKEMPVLEKITNDFSAKGGSASRSGSENPSGSRTTGGKNSQPFKNITIAACLHVTKETAVLAKALVAGGAKVALCGSNPLSTQDDVAAALAKSGVNVFAWRGLSSEKYYWCLNQVLDFKPQITIDDGADLISLIHSKRRALLKTVIGGQEETTTGIIRLRAMAKAGALKYPIVAINDTPTKHMFDNFYGTGQGTIDALLRTTNILLPGKIVVVCGYGYCGSGIANKARGMGARVIITEVNPLLALKAVMDGFEVLPMNQAAKLGEVFITSTGNKAVINREHFKLMKDGAILGNSGHFNVEINVKQLKQTAVSSKLIRDNLEEFTMSAKGGSQPKADQPLVGAKTSGGKDGRKLYLIAEGRLMNLAAAEGHPSSVMDMSFANQALVSEWLVKNHQLLGNKVYEVPKEIDEKVAKMKLASLGVKIDQLTPAQKKYLSSWQEGT